MASPIYFLSYASTNVTTGAYVQLAASTAISCSRLEIVDTSGKFVKIAQGAAGSEVDICTVAVSGSITIPIYLPPGTRLSIEALDNTASTGYIAVSLIGN